jgi:hypothetical protein
MLIKSYIKTLLLKETIKIHKAKSDGAKNVLWRQDNGVLTFFARGSILLTIACLHASTAHYVVSFPRTLTSGTTGRLAR